MHLNEMWDKSEEAFFRAIRLCVLCCVLERDVVPQHLINMVKKIFFLLLVMKCAERAGLTTGESSNGACAHTWVLASTCVRKTDMPVCVILVLSRRQRLKASVRPRSWSYFSLWTRVTKLWCNKKTS